jgi:sugar/nucleoside kinase (ribokinase family)
MKSFDAIAIGSCYVDTNFPDYPFDSTGIPVETELVGGRYETVAGGSAVNFCRLLAALNLKTAFIGMTGADPNGDILESLIRKDGVEPRLIRQPELLTNIGTNLTSPHGEHIMLVAGTANAALNPVTVLPHLEAVIGETKTLYLGGCFKLHALAPVFPQLADIADQHDVALVVDHGRIPHNTPPDITKAVQQLVLRATYYLPSRKEFCELWGVERIEDGLKAVHAKSARLTTIVKDGANGAYFWENDSLQHSSRGLWLYSRRGEGGGPTYPNFSTLASKSPSRYASAAAMAPSRKVSPAARHSLVLVT